MADPIRIANCSGFYGDRRSAALEMVEDGPIDVLTGDWLAELTMLILARTRLKRPGGGYARTFVDQMEQVMGTCLDRGIKVVSNAGGLDPDGCADAVAEVADKLGLAPTIAYVRGDDLLARRSELLEAGVELREVLDAQLAQAGVDLDLLSGLGHQIELLQEGVLEVAVRHGLRVERGELGANRDDDRDDLGELEALSARDALIDERAESDHVGLGRRCGHGG